MNEIVRKIRVLVTEVGAYTRSCQWQAAYEASEKLEEAAEELRSLLNSIQASEGVVRS